MRILVALVLSAALAGCSALGAAGDAQVCDAALSLSSARWLVVQAAASEGRGDQPGAQSLAKHAADLAQTGHDTLQSVSSSDVRRGAAWQALLDAYLHVGQAANALLPDSEGTRGIADAELATASRDLAAAGKALPAQCFAPSPSP